jgi:hypothetical protein
MNNMQSVLNDIIEMSKELLLLRDENREIKSKYEAVVAELEAAQGEINENREQILVLCETIELLMDGEL